MNDLFEKALNAIAKKHGEKTFNNLIFWEKPDQYWQEAAELYAQWVANEAVRSDRENAKNITFWSREENAGILLLSVLKKLPLPFPQTEKEK